jgi:ribokinase
MPDAPPVLFVGGIVADINISGLERFPEPAIEFTPTSDIWHDSPAQVLIGGPAANSAVVYSALAGRCTVAGPIGADRLGDFLNTSLSQSGIQCIGDRVKTTATHTIALGVDGRRQAYYYPGEHIDLLHLSRTWTGGNLYLTALSLTADRPIVPGIIAMTDAAHSAKGIAVLDIGQAGPEMLSFDEISDLRGGIDVLIGNAYEFELLLGESYKTGRRQLRGIFEGTVIVKLGADGLLIDPNPGGDLISITGFPVLSVNPIGAGDAFGGGLMAALSHGLSLIEACEFANAVGALSVSTPKGPEGVNREDVTSILKSVKTA